MMRVFFRLSATMCTREVTGAAVSLKKRLLCISKLATDHSKCIY